MRFEMHGQEQIAIQILAGSLAALPFKASPRALGHARRNRNLQCAMAGDDAAPPAIRAWLRGTDEANFALLLFRGDHAGAAAHGAFVFGSEFEAALGPPHRIFQRNAHLGREIGRLLRARLRAEAEGLEVARSGAARGERRFSEAEKLREEIAHVAGFEARAMGTLRALTRRIAPQDLFLIEAVLPIRAELVVFAPFLRIAEDLISLIDVFELRLGLLVVGIYVRMILARELAVRRLDIGLRSAAFDAEDLVVVFKFHARRSGLTPL